MSIYPSSIPSVFLIGSFDTLMFKNYLTWYNYRHAFTKAFGIGLIMTFFPVFDVPVFWPILLFYWIVLFVTTMKRQIAHMVKYKYIPFTIGKQVIFHSPF